MKKLVPILGLVVLLVVAGCTQTDSNDQPAADTSQSDEQAVDVVTDSSVSTELITAEDEALYTDVQGSDIIAAHDADELSDAEQVALVHMREEEKLARDVYLTLEDYWDWKTFGNIAQSEQTHMDAVLSLLERYEITDPSETMVVGEFENEDLQVLYNQLIKQGTESLQEAFRIGALIEDLDIYDLQQFQQQADNADVLQLFDNLIQGSENHMRAFNRQIERLGGSYQAVYLTQDEIEQILN